ncbi:MAG: hypothetical protein M3176_18000 [Chloroflexota bacterium]|nr:hypothetical protein [Chloroflexota bacterium]
MPINQFDMVALTAPLPDRFTVEIIRGGRTIAVVPLLPDQIRLVRHYRRTRKPNTVKV